MKRLLIMLVMAAMALSAYPAFAAVNGTPHEFLGTTYGRCGTCHVPHAALGGARLWRVAINPTADGTWANSRVGALCGYCHNGASSPTNTNGDNAATYLNTNNVFAAGSHGRNWTRLTGAPLSHTPGNTNGKPYVGATGQPEAGLIECTSCHNPHYVGTWSATNTANVNRPFLRPGVTSPGTLSGFCNDCHDDRFTASISSTTNHPVLIAYNPTIGSDTRQFIQADAAMNTVVGVNHWSLGGKFEGNEVNTQTASTNDLIGCQSCHSIHKPAAPANADGSAYAGGSPRQLLALSYTNSAVCEGCHSARGNGPSGSNLPGGGSVGTLGGDHPYDAVLAGVMVLDAPLWAVTDHGSNGGALCTSCHKAHITTGDGVVNIRRAGQATWCASCHSSISPAAHHSNKTQLGAANSLIDCIDCHDGTGAKAHNGFGFVFKYATGSGCQTCHDGVDPVATVAFGNILAKVPAAHLTPKQGGFATVVSHYLGAFTKDTVKGINPKIGRWSADAIRGGRISAYLKDAAGGALTADRSCYNPGATATATTVIRCESCHSVLGNIGAASGIISASSGWMNNLLLQDYQDDTKNEAAARTVNSDFCIGCHNQLGDGTAANLGTAGGVVGMSLEKASGTVPPGMHPMTNWNITRAVDAGFTGTAAQLITGTAAENTVRNSYADAATAPTYTGGVGTNGVSYAGASHMDCDSCHRPHLANLLWKPTNQTAGNTNVGNTTPVILEDSNTNDYAALCQDCHAY